MLDGALGGFEGFFGELEGKAEEGLFLRRVRGVSSWRMNGGGVDERRFTKGKGHTKRRWLSGFSFVVVNSSAMVG